MSSSLSGFGRQVAAMPAVEAADYLFKLLAKVNCVESGSASD